jgi:curved DNA-binding protein CbpA
MSGASAGARALPTHSGEWMRLGDNGGDQDSVMRIATGCDPSSLTLSPAEGFLLSRIDGRTPRGVLRQIGALAPGEIDRCLERWLKEGVLELVRPGRADAARPAAAKPAAAPAPASAGEVPCAPGLPAVDASLELDVEMQRELLAFAARLGRPYHEILGVSRDADVASIKKAYFALSKKLHPDRYFRRRIGPFAPLVERCFKKLLESYELLSDPNTRAEVQAALPAAAAPSAGAADSARMSSLHARRRLRERVGFLAGAKRAGEERRRKAKSFFEAGMAAFAAERWLEAAGSVRLAIAFDPDNEVYRERFSEVQRRAHEERARLLVKQAEGALELRDFATAASLFEEAVTFRPADPDLAIRAAKLAWQALGELKRAKELAVHAVDLAPENGAYRRVLGCVYKEAGLAANAKRELEAALRIDPQDGEAKAALRGL